MLKMMCYATRYDALMDAWSTPIYAMSVTNADGITRTVNITTTVVPLKEGDKNVFGGKTGTLNRYGYNVGEIAIMPDGRKVAMVTLGASSDKDRAADIREVMRSLELSFNWLSRPNNS